MTGPEFIEGPLDVNPRHLLAPGQVEIGVVHRLGWSVGRLRSRRDGFVGERGSLQGRAGFRDFLRVARDPTEHNARGDDVLPVPLYPCGDAEHREIERASAPQLVVDGIPAIGRRKSYVRQNLVTLLREI